eukprot:CAMPEP_0173393880 /NCGR_PEP_ID=MMETSP1356-20130122/22362_1 /TAXON_ID=77927 ORGANISM="Hemiselmis virescens, Strain PCC157" /NCGR_SAMPLE_ID=MMETSP1356 /ASSEMBLY_ACC=CAM_ASM_000847 /LENGTH=53 /DNA_ID=CAMNT_0014351969 /DNA_START=976 /DNA_END=1137 /DNA_ORIENTATION=-
MPQLAPIHLKHLNSVPVPPVVDRVKGGACAVAAWLEAYAGDDADAVRMEVAGE